MAGVFGYVGGSVDNLLDTFVTQTSTAVSAGIAPLAVTGVTIYVMLYGWAVLRGEVGEPINTFMWKAFKISLIMALALSSGLYQSEIVGMATGIQTALTQMVAPSAAGDIWQVLDDFDAKGGLLAETIMDHGVGLMPWGGYLDLFAGALVYLANAAILIICGGFTMIAVVSSKFILGIGPMFIMALAFPVVANFFTAWFTKFMNYSFLLMTLAALVGFSLAVCTGYITKFSDPGNTTNQVSDAVGLVVVAMSLVLLVWQAPGFAAGLSGGTQLHAGGAGAAVGAAIGGYVMGKLFGGGNKDDDKGSAGGGSVSEGKGNGGGGGDSGGGGDGGKGPPSVPAYRRASYDNMGSNSK